MVNTLLWEPKKTVDWKLIPYSELPVQVQRVWSQPEIIKAPHFNKKIKLMKKNRGFLFFKLQSYKIFPNKSLNSRNWYFFIKKLYEGKKSFLIFSIQLNINNIFEKVVLICWNQQAWNTVKKR